MAGLVDIGVNLTDPMFQGEYHGKACHPPDYDAVLQRAMAAGVERLLPGPPCHMKPFAYPYRERQRQ